MFFIFGICVFIVFVVVFGMIGFVLLNWQGNWCIEDVGLGLLLCEFVLISEYECSLIVVVVEDCEVLQVICFFFLCLMEEFLQVVVVFDQCICDNFNCMIGELSWIEQKFF